MALYFKDIEITNIDNLVPQSELDITDLWFGSTHVYTVWQVYEGTLPATINANGDNIKQYQVWGNVGGVGNDSGTSYGYEIDMNIYVTQKQAHIDTVVIDGITWDILGYDCDTVYKSDGTIAQHSVTIQSQDILMSMPFDSKESIFAFEDGLPAGTYNFYIDTRPDFPSDAGKNLQFTLQNAIPRSGQIVLNGAYSATLVGTTISTFSNQTATSVIETATLTLGSDGINIGTIKNKINGNANSILRAFRGNANYEQSDIRQFLNSDAPIGSVWEAKNRWDRPPAWAANTAGFLNHLSSDFVDHIGTSVKKTVLNNVCDGGGTTTTQDKVFLLSRTEVYGGNETSSAEGTIYPFYAEYSDLSSSGTGADSNRIKEQSGTAKHWWLRTPQILSAINLRCVYPSGSLANYYYAGYSIGIAPVCSLPLDDISTDRWLRDMFLKRLAVPTYIGDEPLKKDEYVDYTEQKVYRRTANLFDISSQTLIDVTGTGAMRTGVYLGFLAVGQYTLTFDAPHNYSLFITRKNGNTYTFQDVRKSQLPFTFQVNSDDEIIIRLTNTQTFEQQGFTNICVVSGTTLPDIYTPYLQPTDPPVPLPALPTCEGTTVVDYAGSGVAPEKVLLKYRKE